mgnify:CR=1 FL=1|tara:strand:+ start:1234 stop:2223 length:990 start_codon:yes stop_codon:yes gene_type:complete
MKKKILLNEKIYVAGGNGMVGRAVKKKLIELGYGNEKNNGKLLTPSRSQLDLLNYYEVDQWFTENKPSIVILAAAKVGGIYANSTKPAEFLLENLKIQTNVIEIAFKHKVKRLLFLGSSCIYPKYAKQPIKEEYLLSGNLECTNQWYAIAKISGIKLCESLRIQYGFDSLALMPTNLYGPFDNYNLKDSHVLPALLKKFKDAVNNNEKYVTCWGDGSPLREFLHVDDLASAIIFTLETWDPSNKKLTNSNDENIFLNVGSGEEISIYDLALKIAKISGFKGEIKWDKNKPNGTPRKLLDISKITNLGWQPKITLDEGILSTYKSFGKEL